MLSSRICPRLAQFNTELVIRAIADGLQEIQRGSCADTRHFRNQASAAPYPSMDSRPPSKLNLAFQRGSCALTFHPKSPQAQSYSGISDPLPKKPLWNRRSLSSLQNSRPCRDTSPPSVHSPTLTKCHQLQSRCV